jgi:Fe-S-cluster containining protein
MQGKLLVKPTIIKGLPGFELLIRDANITVQELLFELNQAYQEQDLPRLWPQKSGDSTGTYGDCEGCSLCCQERLPVTSIDVLQIRKALGLDAMEVFGFLWVEVQGPAVDITLRRRKQRCIFLDQQGRCKIYNQRPLACQTYLCCQTGPRFQEMRSQIINAGMDELVRYSLAAFHQSDRLFPIDRAYSPRINHRDWQKGYFTGKTNYQQLKLARVLSFGLWHSMLLLE